MRADYGDEDPIDGHHDDDGSDDDRPDAELEDDVDGDAPPAPESAGGNGQDDGAAEDLRRKRMALRRRYKIQDVIHRRQVLLVQVVKEERGNKGAALTTYLSLAGRYCVLMPNTTHGGGISRKISNVADRKRLKTIMSELNLPSSMGCIVRTAGLQRTKTEIKRDFDYLARLWDDIRETTLKSQAPALVNEDSDLIKRAIRDIYNRDIDEVIVEGERGYKQARDFMKLLMPSHVKKVKAYADAVPLYQRYGAEDQLEAMYHPVVQLKSGGYLVINPTEALVSIDINSGRSTREHGIEQTAVATNLEAAQEIARQLRLRDMAGLVVIDFIDMESNSNVRKVEKAMKAALANDRARIQVGRISQFGLLEMSRQRLRTGVLEASTRECPHCEGTGLVRTASSAGLSALRMLEEEAARGRGSQLTLRASQEAAFYVLNRKRHELGEIEERYGVLIEVQSDGQLEGARMTVEAAGPPPAFRPTYAPIVDDEPDLDVEEFDDEEEDGEEAEAREEREDREERGDGDARRRGRRRTAHAQSSRPTRRVGRDASRSASHQARPSTGAERSCVADALVGGNQLGQQGRDLCALMHVGRDDYLGLLRPRLRVESLEQPRGRLPVLGRPVDDVLGQSSARANLRFLPPLSEDGVVVPTLGQAQPVRERRVGHADLGAGVGRDAEPRVSLTETVDDFPLGAVLDRLLGLGGLCLFLCWLLRHHATPSKASRIVTCRRRSVCSRHSGPSSGTTGAP